MSPKIIGFRVNRSTISLRVRIREWPDCACRDRQAFAVIPRAGAPCRGAPGAGNHQALQTPRFAAFPLISSPPVRSGARGTSPHGQWQRPSSGVAVRVAVGAPTGSIGQLQIRAGGVSRGRVPVFPASGVTLGVTGGETGCGTIVGAGALTQAQANRANMTNAATSRENVSVFLSEGICRILHETGNNYCLDYEIIRSYQKERGCCRFLARVKPRIFSKISSQN